MAMNGIDDTSIQSQSQAHQTNKSTQPQQDQLSSSRTPSRAPSLHLARRASPMRDLSPGPNALGHTNGLSNGLMSDGASDDGTGASPGWSSAVGRATLGKSGRVIERLMADIDRLKRELNAEIQHRLDVEKREATNRATVDALRAENANLQQAKEVDAAVLKRRDRMIEDLRTELDQERRRRERAEESAKNAARERDEEIAGRRQEVQEAREIAKHATGHAEVLEQSHRQLGTEYRQRCETFAKDLGQMTTERDDEARKVKRLDVVVEQLSQEVEKAKRLNGRMSETMEEYVGQSEKRIDAWRAEATAQRTRCGKLEEEAERVVGEARWLINSSKIGDASH